MPILTLFCVALLNLAPAVTGARPQDLLVIVRNAPSHGLVVERLLFPGPLSGRLTATLANGRSVPAQFVPDPEGAAGVLILRLPGPGSFTLHLKASAESPPATVVPEFVNGKGIALQFSPQKMGGLPSAFLAPGTAARLERFAWNDRVHDPALGGFLLRSDRAPKTEVVDDGPICTVVRTRARYCREDGSRPPSEPEAVYDWYVFRDRPLVYVTGLVRQRDPRAWAELHFLELNVPGSEFSRYAGGEPLTRGDLTGSRKSAEFSSWSVLVGERQSIGLFGSNVRIYDGRGEYGTYLHGPWVQWSDRRARFSAWLWFGGDSDAISTVQAAARSFGAHPTLVVTTPLLHGKIASARIAAEGKAGSARGQAIWRAALAERLESQGRQDEAMRMLGASLPSGWLLRAAGDLGMAVQTLGGGIRLQSLFDLRSGRELLAATVPPLFSIRLKRQANQEEAVLTADSGWRRSLVDTGKNGLILRWADPIDARLKGLAVTAAASPVTPAGAWRWSLQIGNSGTEWGVERVMFPRVAIAEPGPGAGGLYPGGPGLLSRDLWERPYTQKSLYPNGWCTMQFMAVTGAGGRPGLYFGMHDPFGGVKELVMQSNPAERSVSLDYDIPAPNSGRPRTSFTLSGQAVWQILRGDWYDAARIYRAWVRREAKWWPKLTGEGRADTPLWMRELCTWAQTGGAPADCVPGVKRMQAALGLAIGFHWYNWHQIPFDNDYPHYFPTRPGVSEAVKELQAASVFVMPYINGRLWDSRDRGTEDFQFSSVALPSVARQENGQPYLESYGSKESDGSPVRLGVMCPSTELWQRTVRETVLRILNEVGTDGVYIDQIAAASPALCMDSSHRHPTGGGHWWTELGYWPLLARLRANMSKSKMITTECNAEPYVRWMDGYLTWHWQYDGMVPAFPAVYGGAIQMFGRAYGAGASSRDDALCMKIGQQLVFGEQIGWLDPSIAEEKVAGGFLRKAVQMRHKFRRYFYAGEMARPLLLNGSIPTVRADWQWGGERWVTTDAVLTGCWQIPREKRQLILFANVSDKAVTTTVRVDAREYGIPSARLTLSRVEEPASQAVSENVQRTFERRVTFGPREAIAWEITWR